MGQDSIYQNISSSFPQIKHKLGENIHLSSSPYLLSLVQKLSSPETKGPLITELTKRAYNHLFEHIASSVFKTTTVTTETRMATFHPSEGKYHGEIIDPKNKFVCVDVARAGMIPSQLFYEELGYLCDAENIRQDHIYASRKVNEKNEVIGVEFAGSKIGGDIDGAYVIIPDPMGATGKTICQVIDYYKEHIPGKALKFITAHLIITPEYVKQLMVSHPEVEIFAIRYDRGLSPMDILNSMAGEYLDQEQGLNEHQYIVPGAGGVGEILNNSFV